MKKQLRMIAALLSLSMVLLCSACGGSDTSDTPNPSTSTSTSEVAPVALTEEEYQQAVADLETELNEIQQNSQIQTDDLEAAKQLLEDLKQPFVEFKNIVPPEAYADAHAKLQSGCDYMVTYIDSAISLIQEPDTTKQQELTNQMIDALTAAGTDLMEGANMLAKAEINS